MRRFLRASEQILREHGMTNERYELLLAIHDLEQDGTDATVSGLTEVLGVAQVSVTQLVRRMEDAGLVRREVSGTDARVRYVRLTTLGSRRLSGAVSDLLSERLRLSHLAENQ